MSADQPAAIEAGEDQRARLQRLAETLRRSAGAELGLQLWVADDLGFHPRAVTGRPVSDADRAVARLCCVQSTALARDQCLALPLVLGDRLAGACLFAFDRLPSGAEQACAHHIAPLLAELDAALQSERLSRLSGLARSSDRLRTALAIAHSLEHSSNREATYAELRRVLADLLDSRNFFVVLLDEARQFLNFECFYDQYDDNRSPIPYREGGLQGSLSAFVVAAGRVLRGSSKELLQMSGHGDTLEEHVFGPSASDWLGAPMMIGSEAIGALVLQIYEPERRFSDVDPSVLSMVAEAVGAALQRRRQREALERRVMERTEELSAAKDAAEQALQQLRDAQEQLLQSEKMASLGGLVAGVAHEVNTPLGVAITAITHLQNVTQRLRAAVDGGRLTRSLMSDVLEQLNSAEHLVERNLDRAARLIQSFKQVSVDRTSDGRREFPLDTFLDDLLGSMHSLWSERPIEVEVDCPSEIILDGFPGALGQVLSNLLQNALLHAFDEQQSGRIEIRATMLSQAQPKHSRRASDSKTQGPAVCIRVTDSGQGMSCDTLQHIFEPFFTTKRNRGGTGLGLHIVFNLVQQKLGGRIEVTSEPGQGSCFELNLPLRAPD